MGESSVGRGHSPEHTRVCIVPELHLLISGDQVLPKITFPTCQSFPHRSPMRTLLTDWLESLASIKLRIPDDVPRPTFPHNEPFRGLHAPYRATHPGDTSKLLLRCERSTRRAERTAL